jgi:hypothetical protein
MSLHVLGTVPEGDGDVAGEFEPHAGIRPALTAKSHLKVSFCSHPIGLSASYEFSSTRLSVLTHEFEHGSTVALNFALPDAADAFEVI